MANDEWYADFKPWVALAIIAAMIFVILGPLVVVAIFAIQSNALLLLALSWAALSWSILAMVLRKG